MTKASETIECETFRELGFRDRSSIPKREWLVTHQNIDRFQEYRRAILTGICEVLIGAQGHGLDPAGLGVVEIELPPDIIESERLEHGFCACDFATGHIHIRNLVTARRYIRFQKA